MVASPQNNTDEALNEITMATYLRNMFVIIIPPDEYRLGSLKQIPNMAD
jgi:hypothetical protein